MWLEISFCGAYFSFNSFNSVFRISHCLCTSALHGPGFGFKPGPQPVPLYNFAGRAWAYILRAGPGLKTI